MRHVDRAYALKRRCLHHFMVLIGILLSMKSFMAFIPECYYFIHYRVLFVIYFIALLFIIFGGKTVKFQNIIRKNILFILFFIYTFFSVVWSIDPVTTIYRSAALLGTTIFATYIVIYYTFSEFVNLLRLSMMSIVVLSLIAIGVFPEYGIHHEIHAGYWKGIFPHKNDLGRAIGFAAIFFFALLTLLREKKIINLIFFSLSMLLLIYSHSIAAWYLTVVLMLSLYSLYELGKIVYSLKAAIMLFLFAIIFTTAIWFSSELTMFIEKILDLSGHDFTLTNRIYIWQWCLSQIKNNLILGHGYSTIELPYYFKASVPHMGYIELLYDLGILGSLLIISIYVSVYRRINNVKKINYIQYTLLGFFFLYVIVFSASNLFVRQHTFIWLIFSILVIYLSKGNMASHEQS